MPWTDDDYIAAFDAEAGGLETLTTDAHKILWFNEGQTRLIRQKAATDDISWSAGDREVALPADFKTMDKIIFDQDSYDEPWRVWGKFLVMDDSEGANSDGSARVYFWAEWTPMTGGTLQTDLTLAQDNACMYYALSRFYRLLSSNRAYYKRYATLVGQNATSMSDLQQEADRYYQDFLDSREDFEPDPPASYFVD